MKVTPNNYSDMSYRQNNLPKQPNVAGAKTLHSNVSFGSWKSGVGNVMEFIERKGFFAEFLIVDTFSMIAPRILIGLNRDRKDTKERKGTGKLNYKAGAEEALREILSGPSMFLIPMGILTAVKKFGPAAKIPKDTMHGLTSNLEEVVKEAKDSKIFEKAETIDEALAGKLFDSTFARHDLDGREDLKKQFVEKLINRDPGPKKKLFSLDKVITPADEFEKVVVLINNNVKKPTTKETRIISDGKDFETTALKLFEDFKHYSSDVIEKLTQKNFVKEGVEKFRTGAEEFLTGIQKNRSNRRIRASWASFAAVGAFLFYLPKIYQLSKLSPAAESALREQKESQKGGANASK